MYRFLCLLLLPVLKAQDCPANSHLEPCPNPSQLSCQNLRYGDVDFFPECIPQCVCNEGYIKDETTSECILPNECSTIGNCGPNQEFRFCVNCNGVLETTCSNYGQPPRPIACLQGCLAGCFCKSGYIFDERKKKCVLPKHCSCEGNQIFVICKTGPFPIDEKCGCQCRSGYNYDYTVGRCVRVAGAKCNN